MKFSIISKNETETKNMAKAAAACFLEGDMILLDGELGAGKTYFVKGFAAGIGSDNTVTSPTFGIANFYKSTQKNLLHIDLYRIETIEEFENIGLADFFPENIVLIEWGSKFSQCFGNYFKILVEYFETDKRILTFSFEGEIYKPVFESVKQKLSTFTQC